MGEGGREKGGFGVGGGGGGGHSSPHISSGAAAAAAAAGDTHKSCPHRPYSLGAGQTGAKRKSPMRNSKNISEKAISLFYKGL